MRKSTNLNKLFSGVIEEGSSEVQITPDLLSSANLMATKYREIADNIEQDYEALYSQLEKLESNLLEWNYSCSKLKGNALSHLDTIKNKLFLQSNSDGFYHVFSESLDTGTAIDILTKTVHSNKLSSISLAPKRGAKEVDPSLFTISISNAPNAPVYRVVTAEGSSLDAIKGSSENGWIGIVTSSIKIEPSLVFTLNFKEEVEINDVFFKLGSNSSATTASVLAITETQSTSKGENLSLSYTNNFNIGQKVKSIKVLLKKHSEDIQNSDQTYGYVFNIKAIIPSISGFEKEGTFESKYYFAGGSKLAIEVCDTEPEGTSLNYFIKYYDQNEILQPIQPLNKPPSNKPYGLFWSKETLTSNYKDPQPLDPLRPSSSIIQPVTSSLEFLNSIGNLFCLNQKIKIDINKLNHVKVFSNLRNGVLTSPKSLYEEKGNYLYTWIYVPNKDARINVGPSEINILGAKKEGTVITFMSPGWYQVKIPLSSFQDRGNSFASLNELKSLDPLYPYNAKYLIEGADLPGSPYLGFERQAKSCLAHVSNLSNLSSNSYHLYKTEDYHVCVVDPGLNAKDLYIEYLKSDLNSFQSFKLVAKMKTLDGKFSPVLSSYKIKIGD